MLAWLSTTATISYSKWDSWERNSLATRISTLAQRAATRSSEVSTPKWAVPLWMRLTQSNRSTPMTHSMLLLASSSGQNLGVFR